MLTPPPTHPPLVITTLQELDTTGVGELIEIAAKRGKATRPDLHLGICGARAQRGGISSGRVWWCKLGQGHPPRPAPGINRVWRSGSRGCQ